MTTAIERPIELLLFASECDCISAMPRAPTDSNSTATRISTKPTPSWRAVRRGRSLGCAVRWFTVRARRAGDAGTDDAARGQIDAAMIAGAELASGDIGNEAREGAGAAGGAGLAAAGVAQSGHGPERDAVRNQDRIDDLAGRAVGLERVDRAARGSACGLQRAAPVVAR